MNSNKNDEKKTNGHFFDSLNDISKSLPPNITRLTKTQEEDLFSSHLRKDIVTRWISVSRSIFGDYNVDLDSSSKSKEIRDKLKTHPHEKIDDLILEVNEEIRDSLREQLIHFGLPQRFYVDDDGC